jgi:hypothetical protein
LEWRCGKNALVVMPIIAESRAVSPHGCITFIKHDNFLSLRLRNILTVFPTTPDYWFAFYLISQQSCGYDRMFKVKVLDFLVIGVPKAGTTALFRYLRCHPQIYIPPAKEVPFFSEDDQFAKGWDSFAQEFFIHAPFKRLWGKITPQYWQDSRVPERLFHAMPNVKLIVQLRNPIERAYSHYLFLFRRGAETRPFEEVVFDKNWKKYSYYAPLGEYGRILKNYLNYFPSEQLLVTFSEDLDKRPQYVLDSIMTHLGMKQGFKPDNLGKRYNVGGIKTRFPWLIALVKKTAPLKRIWRTLPKRSRSAFGRWFFFEVAPVPEKANALPAELRQKLVEFYRQDVMELERLIHQKVPWQDFKGALNASVPERMFE